MTSIHKSTRFKQFRKKHRKDEAILEILDYIALLEYQLNELEKTVVALENADELHG